MQKDFDLWNEKKKVVNTHDTNEIYFYEREIWWVHLGANVGFEQDGTGDRFDRPVVIVKKFNPRVFLCIPVSTTEKEGKYYFSVGIVENRRAKAVLSQLRLLDAKRLINRAGILEVTIFDEMVKMLIKTLFTKIGKNSPPSLAGRG